MKTPLETVSATEASALLGLSRERLRQMVVADELPERVAASSPFRPRYGRLEILAFGRASGRIESSRACAPMRLAVDELMLPVADRRDPHDQLPAHVRVWEREGWPPLVVIAAPIDGDRTIQVDAETWHDRVRSRFLDGAGEVRWVELWPDHLSSSRLDADGVYLEVRRGRHCLSFRRRHRREQLAWSRISHAAVEQMAGGEVSRIPRALYTIGVVSRLLEADGLPVVVEWDPWELRELASAVLNVADGASRLPSDDASLALDIAGFAARAARLVEDRTREAAPDSTSVVAIDPVSLDAKTWRRLEQVGAPDRMRASAPQSLPERANEIRIVRDGVDRMLLEHGDEMPWRLRESISRLRAFLPDPGDETDVEDVRG